MSSKPGTIYSAYHTSQWATKTKVNAIVAMLPVWQDGLKTVAAMWQREWHTTGKLPRWIDTKPLDGGLSQRQWDSVSRQYRGMLVSWMELAENRFRSIVRDSTLDEPVKIELFRINLKHAWYEPGDDGAHWLARRIMKRVRHVMRLPDPAHCRTMSLDGKIAVIEQPHTATRFRYWARISTLEKGHPVRIPLNTDPRMEERLANGMETLANHLQLQVTGNGKLVPHLLTTRPETNPRDDGDVLGLDWGMCSLFATSEGRLHGLKLYAWLKKRDEELVNLTKALQASGIKPSRSKRYRNLNRRIRNYVTNETNRVLNLIADEQVRELVVEDLDFRSPKLGKDMNRLVSRAGRNAVNQKLKALKEREGITITKVNPAYTSQTCPSCGCVDKRNRTKQSVFHCVCCGRTGQADIIASRNILARRSRKDGWRRISKTQVREQLAQEHSQRRHRHGNKCQAGTPTTSTATAHTHPAPAGRIGGQENR
ncbi:transposase, IS605 OrfB family [Bifidobacterium gallicum DSM 20093 = LMG 11596]|uniref:Transposase, IS605 OrfB family n=2 Tax=Bifidobacterium gallicum DSM 20093 = LMG 11596 TaxID=561180 RepID=D1NTK4_9BIFI|nr:RNA-guided endonuclease TnpB family protein [Bifidobacterium gallicum]EFA23058.1 transposase, IS605 OrfB family [Bifidobacterium gallicum DSM 20093 = LMG 11596]